jgi:hypothetical protein
MCNPSKGSNLTKFDLLEELLHGGKDAITFNFVPNIGFYAGRLHHVRRGWAA